MANVKGEAMNETYVTMIGNAVEDPVRRVTRDEAAYITFRLASTVRRRNPLTGEYEDQGTAFVTVAAFNRLARNVAESVRKGHPVVVTGRLKVRQWSTGEKSGTSVDIDAVSIGHDLSRGVSHFTKVLPSQRDSDTLPPQSAGGSWAPSAPSYGPDAGASVPFDTVLEAPGCPEEYDDEALTEDPRVAVGA